MASATPVDKLRGISEELAAKLKGQQITNSDLLLKAGCTPEARQALAKKIGADPKALLELLNRADLDRVSGIGAAYSNLLEEAGVDTVKELSKRVAANLHAKILEINTAKKVTTHPPTLAMVEAWVAEAKALPPMMEY
jgi:predicted flap endonuclease-1-like 5' DNA nuclease